VSTLTNTDNHPGLISTVIKPKKFKIELPKPKEKELKNAWVVKEEITEEINPEDLSPKSLKKYLKKNVKEQKRERRKEKKEMKLEFKKEFLKQSKKQVVEIGQIKPGVSVKRI